MTVHEFSREQRETEFDHTDFSVPAKLVRQKFTDMRESCPIEHSEHFGGLDYVSRYADVRAMLRALVDGPLNSRASRAFGPTIEEIAHLLIDGFADQGVADLAVQRTEALPAIVIGRLVGLSHDDAAEVRERSMAAFTSIGMPGFPRHMDRFDANRPNNSHVAFGRGLHACSGQHLARAEMRLALKASRTRFSDVHLAGDVDETRLSGGWMIEVKSPVTFTPEF